MRRSILGICAIGLIGCAAAAPAQWAQISVSCNAVGQELEICRDGVAAWERKTGHAVRLVSTPNSASDRLALYQQLLAGHASDIDVPQIDVVWPGILANHFLDLKTYAAAQVEAHFPVVVENNTVNGRLVAMPWFIDAPMLYYRRDLLEKYREPVPRTWRELTDVARRVQDAERAAGNERLWGFVWQGRAYEGLTCDALEWIASYGGGQIVDSDGAISVNNPRAAFTGRI